ncbi:MAG TPA: ABC transporter ATP-binding protein, partial [Nordella sp.]|nr:ABC transporter ATP-binding protein [Nordella sp.]
VDGVDLDIEAGEILTVVGESGSGKSVTALSIMRLIAPPGQIVRGEIRLRDRNLLSLSPREMQAVRGRAIAMVFQNPYAALHPMYRIGHQMSEAIRLNTGHSADAHAKAIELLTRIHVEDPESVLKSYPFEVSAGVCQRVMLAIALAARPALLIADEPTTNLDAMAQAEILGLIKEMRNEYGMSVLLITHDFGVVSAMADRVLVMYAGRPAEAGPARAVLTHPVHPYAKGLIGSVMNAKTKARRLTQISGEAPDVMHLPPGCSFRVRCPEAFSRCEADPPMSGRDDTHHARCWRTMADGAGHG